MIDKIKQLRERDTIWNLDYFEFLVERVWKLNKPARIIDFGCGGGYMGAMLLPLLPLGSTYAGLDINQKFLNRARETFVNSGWITEFYEVDLIQYEANEIYDIAICHGVLNHIPQPDTILRKMIQSVIPGGRVICIESNAIVASCAADYYHGMEKFRHMILA